MGPSGWVMIFTLHCNSTVIPTFDLKFFGEDNDCWHGRIAHIHTVTHLAVHIHYIANTCFTRKHVNNQHSRKLVKARLRDTINNATVALFSAALLIR